MGIKTTIIKPYIRKVAKQTQQWLKNAVSAQETMARLLIDRSVLTEFGKEHQFQKIVTYKDFVAQIPIRTLADYKPYLDKIANGDKDVTWPSKPRYLVSDNAYDGFLFPVTRESIGHFYEAGRDAVFNYASLMPDPSFIEGKIIYLPAYQKYEKIGGITCANLNWIASKYIPSWTKTGKIPSFHESQITPDQDRILTIANKSKQKGATMLVGSPDQILFYHQALTNGKGTIKDHLAKLQCVLTGPITNDQRQSLSERIGAFPDIISSLVTPMGYIGFQDDVRQSSYLLNVANGMYFEFAPLTAPKERFWLKQIELNTPYKLIISTNAGLWSVDTDLTIQFVQFNPFKFILL
jgi:hypothetical protein